MRQPLQQLPGAVLLTSMACMQPGKAAPVRYKGPVDVLRHVRTEKGIAGLYRGMTPTLAREVAGNATMFAIYEALKSKAAAMQVINLLLLG